MNGLEIRLLSPDFLQELIRFYTSIEADQAYFHPHPFSEEYASQLIHYNGKDLYYVITNSDKMITGYGMLRGWDEGYKIPSLGIIVHPDWRGKGLGYLLMLFLHQAAKARGAEKIRLKVYPDNTQAVHVYQKLGYVFEDNLSDNQLVGYLTLV